VRRVSFIQVGIGTVGGAVVQQVLDHRDRWRRDLGLEVGVGAVVTRAGALVALDPVGLPEETLRAVVDGRRAGTGLSDIARDRGMPLGAAGPEAIERPPAGERLVVLDAAAGDATAALDVRALEVGGGVVLSNKAPLALPASDPAAAALWAAAGPHGRLRYEATCGAGLPVISSLRSLLDTGDEVIEIQGALSGTLGAIFSDVAAGQSFSAAVRSATERGYTEPDPRDDLSGLDVARKALILARTIGRRVDLDAIEVESLVPPGLTEVSIAEFLERVAELDAPIAARAAAAKSEGRALKYVATVRPDGTIVVGVRPVDTSTVLGALQGPETIVMIRTRRYDDYPLNVAGPGAGAAVTAAGMLADALALATGPLAGPVRGNER